MEQIQQQLSALQQAVAQADARAAAAEQRAAATEQSLPSLTLLLSSLNQLPAAIQSAAASAGAAPATQSRSLVDVRGLGKPPLFNNVEADYMMWSRKVESYVGSIYPQCRKILTWCSEKSTAVLIDDVQLDHADVEEKIIREFDEQMHSVLMALTIGEPFDITVGSGAGCGLEGWRRLSRRWGPLTAGRARGLLRDILAPSRCKLAELQQGVDRLEEQMRRYTSRRGADGSSHTLAEDI
jgi:hypothetical protein